VEMCPTGALFERDKRYRGTPSQRTATTCSFCGCGCSFWLEVSSNQVVGVRPGISGSVNGMTLCAKGHYGYDFINHPDRLKQPLMRREGNLTEVTWEEALSAAAEGLKRVKEDHGGDSLAILAGAHCTNEEAFLLKDFASHVLETNRITCSSTYMSKLIRGMEETLGYFGTVDSIRDLEEAEGILVIGANPTETAPIVGYSIKRGVRKKKNVLMVVDPLEIKLVKHARLWLQPHVGSDEILLLGMLKILLEEQGELLRGHSSFSKSGIQNLKEIQKRIKHFSLKDVERKAGISLESLRELLNILCSSERRALVFGNGIIQQPNGDNLVRMLCSLASLIGLTTGKETMVLPLIKESNALGSIHMGIMDKETSESVLNGIADGRIRGLWIIGEDPLVSFPGVTDMEKNLDRLDFLIVSDTFLSDTGDKADVVFPAVSFAEKSGTLTNMEGRVQMIRQAIDPVGESRPDWQIILLLAEALGSPYRFRSERDITEEIVKSIPLYAGMHLGEMVSEYFSYKLPLERGKGTRFFVPEEISGAPKADKKFPYTLMLGSVLFQLGFGHETKHSPRLSKIIGEEYVEINPEDAAEENIHDGEVIKLVSSTGEKRIETLLSERIPRGVLFLPRPFARNSAVIPFSAEGRKTCRVKIQRI
jgi:predicted molibdopterin-dependent oxidoreductase YjgC